MAMTDERNAARANGERGKAVDAAILAIEKQFGRGSIMKLGSQERQQVESIPTGSIALDLALGGGRGLAALGPAVLLAALAQLGHGDLVAAADVDAPQEGGVGRHPRIVVHRRVYARRR